MEKVIGILGGMGPLATADLFKKITLLTRASSDREHLRVVIDSNAKIPDRTGAILSGGADPVPEMLSALRNLERCGADVILMPCNTAHHFLPRLQPETELPFLNMIETTVARCRALFPGKTAGLWATSGTVKSGVYTDVLAREGVSCVLPTEEEQAVMMDAIYRVKGGETLRDAAAFDGLAASMRARGADFFILGCTELPIVYDMLHLSGDFIDPTAELARAAVLFCGKELND